MNIPLPVLNKMEEYEDIKNKIKGLEERLKELAPEILHNIPQDDNGNYVEIETKSGKFYVQDRGTWKYSDLLESEKKEIKEREKAEKADGTATKEPKPVLYYSVHKE